MLELKNNKNNNKKAITPEANYQEIKSQWYLHPSSWYVRNKGEGGYDGKGCNQFTGCITTCRFFKEYGRLEENEKFT
ncbi:MAG: hypothetical protein ACPKQO_04235 [Nitrososphaeraceae archaeon]